MSDRQTAYDPSIMIADETVRMQQKIENLYLKYLTLERDVVAMRTTHPLIVRRPARASLAWRILRRINPRMRRRYHVSLIRTCGLFDATWYLRTYQDVADSGADPVEHYMFHGATDLRDPGPYFDTQHYLHLYPDIAGNKMNPLVHYVVSGCDEGRSIRPGMPHKGLMVSPDAT
jgi:hypothetical protein